MNTKENLFYKEKKYEKILLLIISMVTVLLLVACNKITENNNVPVNVENNKEEIVDSNDTVKKIDDSKSFVYTIYTNETYEGVEIPFINIDSDDAERFNNKMKSIAENVEEQRKEDAEVRNDYEKGSEFAEKVWDDWYEGIEYAYYQNDDILSLVIKYKKGYVAGWTQYETYNINIKSGKEYKQLDLVNTYREENNLMDEKKFMKRVEEAYLEQVNYDVKMYFPDASNEYVESLQESTKNNIPKAINEVELYVGENNIIYIFVKGFNGAEYYWNSIEYNIRDSSLDLSYPISVYELLLKNGLEISNIEDNKEYTLDLGEIVIGTTKGNLSILVKKESNYNNISYSLNFNGNFIHEDMTDLEYATLAKFKDYLLCTGAYDWSGGNIYIYNQNGQIVHTSSIGLDKLRIEKDVLLYSVDYGKLLEVSLDGITKYAREDYELREENGIFTEILVNVDENDIVYGTEI